MVFDFKRTLDNNTPVFVYNITVLNLHYLQVNIKTNNPLEQRMSLNKPLENLITERNECTRTTVRLYGVTWCFFFFFSACSRTILCPRTHDV